MTSIPSQDQDKLQSLLDTVAALRQSEFPHLDQELISAILVRQAEGLLESDAMREIEAMVERYLAKAS